METVVKEFSELNVLELYEILRLRSAVFVVEQNCVYQDIDDFDLNAIHVFLKENNEIIAYLRILRANSKFDDVSFGRVISKYRRRGNGLILLNKAIEVVKNNLNADSILIEAQTYAKSFYECVGFKQCSDEFLEDGIPHIKMILKT